MPDQTRLYVLGAFVLGVGLTAAWNARNTDKRARDVSSAKYLEQHKKHLKQFSKVQDPVLLKKCVIRLADSLELDVNDIKEGIEGCIGNTPLIKIKSLSDATGCEILAKAEFLNGAGNSPKDRVALSIIELAEEKGLLIPHSGDTIYEGTVGSTGISLAAICRARGYKAHMCAYLVESNPT